MCEAQPSGEAWRVRTPGFDLELVRSLGRGSVRRLRHGGTAVRARRPRVQRGDVLVRDLQVHVVHQLLWGLQADVDVNLCQRNGTRASTIQRACQYNFRGWDSEITDKVSFWLFCRRNST